MEQPATEKVFNTLNEISLKFFYVYAYEGFICLSLWTILSIIWIAILVSRMHSESKKLKYQSRNRCTMDKDRWAFWEKNYKLKRTGNLLMILLCIMEIFASVSVISCWGHSISVSKASVSLHLRVLRPFINILNDSFSIKYRLLHGVLASAIISMLDIISLITAHFIERYTFFPSKCKHPVCYGFIRLSFKISVMMALCSVVQLFIFMLIVGVLLYVFEYIRLIKLSYKLCRLLHQRYFDARFHENQHPNVVRYYRQIHFEFKIGSIIILTSLFFELISIIIQCLYPIVLTAIIDPNWFNLVYNIHIQMEYTVPWNNWVILSVDQVMVMIMGVSMGVFLFILTVPYFLITCLFFVKKINKIRKYRYYTFRSELIQGMIERHNDNYTA